MKKKQQKLLWRPMNGTIFGGILCRQMKKGDLSAVLQLILTFD